MSSGKIFLLAEREREKEKKQVIKPEKGRSLLLFSKVSKRYAPCSHDRFFPPGRRWHVKRTDRGAELLFSSWLVRNQSCHRPSVTPDPVIRSVARRGFSSASFNLLRSSSPETRFPSPLLSDVLINNRSLSWNISLSLSLQIFTTCCPLGEKGSLLFSCRRMWVGSRRFVRIPSLFYRLWIGLWRVFEVNRGGNKRFDVCYCIWEWKGGGRVFGRKYFGFGRWCILWVRCKLKRRVFDFVVRFVNLWINMN